MLLGVTTTLTWLDYLLIFILVIVALFIARRFP